MLGADHLWLWAISLDPWWWESGLKSKVATQYTLKAIFENCVSTQILREINFVSKVSSYGQTLILRKIEWFLFRLGAHSAEKWKIYSHWKIFRQISYLVILLVKPLISRNFCQRSMIVNFNNFHTVEQSQITVGNTAKFLPFRCVKMINSSSQLFGSTQQ